MCTRTHPRTFLHVLQRKPTSSPRCTMQPPRKDRLSAPTTRCRCTQTGLLDLLKDELRKKKEHGTVAQHGDTEPGERAPGEPPGVGRLFIVGLALDVAVRHTAEDAMLLCAAWKEEAKKAETAACCSDTAADGVATGTGRRSHSQTPWGSHARPVTSQQRVSPLGSTRAANGSGGGRPPTREFGGPSASVIEEKPEAEAAADVLSRAGGAGRGDTPAGAGAVTETFRGVHSVFTQSADFIDSTTADPHQAAPMSMSSRAAANHVDRLRQHQAQRRCLPLELWSEVQRPLPLGAGPMMLGLGSGDRLSLPLIASLLRHCC